MARRSASTWLTVYGTPSGFDVMNMASVIPNAGATVAGSSPVEAKRWVKAATVLGRTGSLPETKHRTADRSSSAT